MKTKYGFNFSPEDIEKYTINEFGPKGLIKGIEVDMASFTNSRIWFHLPLCDGKLFEGIAMKCTIVFNWSFFTAVFVLSICICLYSLSNYSIGIRDGVSGYQNGFSPFVIILYLISLLAHEFGHITACYRFDTKPRKVGIGLYLIIPVLYSDLSQTWTLSKKTKNCD